jgi:hypothetical protein
MFSDFTPERSGLPRARGKYNQQILGVEVDKDKYFNHYTKKYARVVKW